MAYYGNNFYDREVIRERPCDSYSGCNRVEADYGRPGYPIGHHHHHPHNNVVTDVVYESSTIPSYGHHHHNHPHGGVEVVERKEERIIYENDYDPYRRVSVFITSISQSIQFWLQIYSLIIIPSSSMPCSNDNSCLQIY